MPYPTLQQLQDADPTAYTGLKSGLEGFATHIDGNAGRMASDITGLHWSGQSHDAAVGRANEEKTSIGRIADSARAAAKDIQHGVDVLVEIRNTLVLAVLGLWADSYKVDQDWTVQDDFRYPTGGDHAHQEAVKKKRLEREAKARDESAALKSRAGTFATADSDLATKVSGHARDLGRLSPAAAGLSQKSADATIYALEHHLPLTNSQKQELAAATNLSEQQVADIRAGRPVDIGTAQFRYLQELMTGLGDKSPGDIRNLANYLNPSDRDGMRASLANGMQIISNPLVENSATGSRGGMEFLPQAVTEAIRKDPIDH